MKQNNYIFRKILIKFLKNIFFKKYFCISIIIFLFNNISMIAYCEQINNVPQDVLEFADKNGYDKLERIWYLSGTCIKNTTYIDIFWAPKKNNNKKYRYILYSNKRIRFATKSEQIKYIEGRYF